MKVTYLPSTCISRSGEIVMCRDLEVGEEAEDRGDRFAMLEDGLYFNGKLNTEMATILEYRTHGTWCNREVVIL